MHARLLLPLLAVLLLGASTGARPQQASSTVSRAASSVSASRSGSASASATASAGNGTTSGNSTATNGTTTGGNSTNTTTTSTRPPITATASEITTGALAGTAVAPAPGVNVPGIAKGPDDSYVNHAHALAAGSLALSVVLGGALLF